MAESLPKIKADHPEWAWAHQAEIYRERDLLVALLARAYPSHIALHPRSGKKTICVHAPCGRLAWTLNDDNALALYRNQCERGEADAGKFTRAEQCAVIERHVAKEPCIFPRDATVLRRST